MCKAGRWRLGNHRIWNTSAASTATRPRPSHSHLSPTHQHRHSPPLAAPLFFAIVPVLADRSVVCLPVGYNTVVPFLGLPGSLASDTRAPACGPPLQQGTGGAGIRSIQQHPTCVCRVPLAFSVRPWPAICVCDANGVTISAEGTAATATPCILR